MKGVKGDNGKLRYDLVAVEMHESLAKILTYGANKYDDDNWIKVELHRYEAALFRHLNAWRKGEPFDDESGFHHLEHALSNLGIILCKVLYPWKYRKGENGYMDSVTSITDDEYKTAYDEQMDFINNYESLSKECNDHLDEQEKSSKEVYGKNWGSEEKELSESDKYYFDMRYLDQK